MCTGNRTTFDNLRPSTMKRTLILLALTCGQLLAWGQSGLNLDDAGWYGSMQPADVLPKEMVVDQRGDYYVLGSIDGGCDFDPGTPFVPIGSSRNYPYLLENYIVKYSVQGTLLWAKHLPILADIHAMALLASGDLVFAGSGEGIVDVDPGPGEHLLGSANLNTTWMFSLTRHGEFRWAVQFPLAANHAFEPLDLCTSPSGDIYVAGHFTGAAIDFDPGPGNSVLGSTGGVDAVVARYDSLGGFRWVKAFTGPEYESATAIRYMEDGSLRVAGIFEGSTDFDPGSAQVILTASPWAMYATNAFITALDSLGGLQWVNHIDSQQSVSVADLAGDSASTCWVTGVATGDADFDRFDNLGPIQSNYRAPYYIAQYDALGQLSQAGLVGGTGSILPDQHGGVFLSGLTVMGVDMDPSVDTFLMNSYGQDDAFVAHFEDSLALDWAFNFGDYENDYAAAMVPGPYGSVVVAAAFYSRADLDPGLNTALAQHDNGFGHAIAAYNQHGSHLWSSATTTTRGGEESVAKVLLDGQGNMNLLGYFYGEIDIDLDSGQTLLTPGPTNSNQTISIHQYGPQGALNWGFRFGNGGYHPRFGFFLDAQDNVAFVTTTSTAIDIDPGSGVTQLIPTGTGSQSVPLVAKYTSAGALAWGHLVQSAPTSLEAAAMDQAGNFYLAGGLNGTVDFDPGPGQTNLTGTNYQNYLQKLDANGNLMRAILFDARVNISRLVPTPQGGLYILGIADLGGDLDPDSASAYPIAASNNQFIAYYDSQGRLKHVIEYPYISNNQRILLQGATSDNAGRLLAYGHFAGPYDFDPGPSVQQLPYPPQYAAAYLARFDSTLQLTGLRGFDPYARVTLNGIAVASDGRILVGGNHDNTAILDSSAAGGTLEPGRNTSALIVVLDSNLAYQTGASLVNHHSYASIYGVAFAPDGSIGVGGITSGHVDMDPGAGSHILHAYGQGDAFYGRYHQCNPIAISFPQPNAVFCADVLGIALPPGSPAGGTYAGTGVSGSMFSPQAAGPGTHQVSYTYLDSAGCSHTSWTTLTVEVCLGAPEVDPSPQPALTLYPNPSTGRLAIQLSAWAGGVIDLQLFDATGRQVHSVQWASPDQELDLALLPAGVYYVRVATDDLRVIRRWVKID